MQEGIYESIIYLALKKKLDLISRDRFLIHELEVDPTEASIILTNYLSKLIMIALKEFKDNNQVEQQIKFINDLIHFIDNELHLELSNDLILQEGRILTAIVSKIAKTDEQIINSIKESLPLTGLRTSSLFTGSNAEISIDSELERDILSANRILWIVSFIRWSGLRIFERAIKEFTNRENAEFKIITTTYMAASEPKALDFLSRLPRTEIRVSYQTKLERLHAKSYIFERNSGFDTAYIGSSNLSHSALTKGLEWNIRVTAQENPHIIQKAKATFELYWNSPEFENFVEGGIEKFQKAIAAEKHSKTSININEYFRISLFPFQKAILEKLTVERTLHHRYRNLIVSATGTGKTVIAAFDFKKIYDSRGGDCTLLFVAHREEILIQSLNQFRAVLGQRDFGQLWVGNHQPNDGDLRHLFVSVQTFNSKKEIFASRFTKDYYEFIVIDEAHHSQANSYRILFELFNPIILLGLTATPERMDGKSLLPDFCNHIAAEIRLPDALSLKLLSPFQYFCITDDSVDLRNITWTSGRYDPSELTVVLNDQRRVRLIIDAISHYLTDPNTCKALCFCTTISHAKFMSESLNKAGFSATCLVSNDTVDAEENRKSIRQQLQQGKINYVCVVDIFNEGVDIPEIDTVLFLRPTESLTIFLQQLGRGLRISENKECLTVLDFVSQANVQYNFSEKFRALVGKTDQNISKEIDLGFPHLPAGCSIKMEVAARDYILNNIRNAIFNSRRLIREISSFQNNTEMVLTLTNFLNHHHIDIRTIYANGRSWSGYKKEAGMLKFDITGFTEDISKGLRRLVQIDSPAYLNFVRDLLNNSFICHPSDIIDRKFALMFYYDIWQKGISHFGFDSIYRGIQELNNYPFVKQEIGEIVDYLWENITRTNPLSTTSFEVALELHARYSRDQILAAFNKSTPERPFPSQEGVISLSELNAEILLVTLSKSDKDFSESTQYDDYAISETIFHWQSQNRVSPESPVGVSYIDQNKIGKTLLLFVRENKKDNFGFTCPYYYLGPVGYRSHKGSRPMSIKWELAEPMPADLFKVAAKMAAG